jgi:hypothetical protein
MNAKIKSSIQILFLDHVSRVAREISFYNIFGIAHVAKQRCEAIFGNLNFVQDHRGRARHGAIAVEGMAPHRDNRDKRDLRRERLQRRTSLRRTQPRALLSEQRSDAWHKALTNARSSRSSDGRHPRGPATGSEASTQVTL